MKWKEKTETNRVVSLGNGSRHQIRSFLGRTLGGQQLHIMHILHIVYLNAYFRYQNTYITYNLPRACMHILGA